MRKKILLVLLIFGFTLGIFNIFLYPFKNSENFLYLDLDKIITKIIVTNNAMAQWCEDSICIRMTCVYSPGFNCDIIDDTCIIIPCGIGGNE